MDLKKNVWLPAILSLALLWGFTGCGKAPTGAKELETEKTAINLVQEVARGGYQVIPASTLKEWLDQKKPMLIIDTMPLEASYKKQHIPGAVQFEFPLPEVKEMDEATKAKFEQVLGPDKDRTLVLLRLHQMHPQPQRAMWAVKLGYKNVYRYPGGIKAWMEAGYPVEKGG